MLSRGLTQNHYLIVHITNPAVDARRTGLILLLKRNYRPLIYSYLHEHKSSNHTPTTGSVAAPR